MVCEDCKVEMRVRKATVKEPYRYKLSGLENVALAGIDVYVCPQCGAESPVIPKIVELHRVLALAVVEKKGALDADEVRFLRKWLGYSSGRFAELMGFTIEHLSRVEHGHKPLGTTSERLLRILALTAARKTEFSDVSKLLDRLNGKAGLARHKPLFELKRNSWKAAA
jgi:DNA-binding transcriptional regulator YiaG